MPDVRCVLIADKVEPECREGLEALADRVVYAPDASGDDLVAAIRSESPTVLVVRSTKVPSDALAAGEDLKLVIRAGSGFDNVDTAFAAERDIAVCNCPGMNAVAVAELTLGHLIALDRRLPEQDAALKVGKWDKKGFGKARGLKGRSVLVVGTGAIGIEVIRRLQAFGMDVWAQSRSLTEEVARALGVKWIPFTREALLEAVPRFDVVTVHVPAMGDRVYNFSAGPAMLPGACSSGPQDIFDIDGSGIGILEHSHRGKVFDRITAETEADVPRDRVDPRRLRVFWMQGGATSQCYFVPANSAAPDRTADYFQTGKWANDSIKEAPLYGGCHICGSSKETNYNRYIPTGDEVKYSDNPVYVHFTSNNTIMGTEFHAEPTPPAGRSSCATRRATSSAADRRDEVRLIYAGAQKNLGPAGITLVIAKDLIESPCASCPR
jgi:hypothetical protein